MYQLRRLHRCCCLSVIGSFLLLAIACEEYTDFSEDLVAGSMPAKALTNTTYPEGCIEGNTVYLESCVADTDPDSDYTPAMKRAMAALNDTDLNVGRLDFCRGTSCAGRTFQFKYDSSRDSNRYQINLNGMDNVTVDGKGAMLLNDPHMASIEMNNCNECTVKNLVIDQAPLGYTQGKVIDKDVGSGKFLIKRMSGYPKIPGDARLTWGAFIDQKKEVIRWNMAAQFFPMHAKSYTSDDDGSTYWIRVNDDYKRQLIKVKNGDIYFQPLFFIDSAHNISIKHSSDCLLENVILYSGRSAMSSWVVNNTGPITIRGFQVKPKPGTDRVVSNWRDGVHCENNRVGPIIENCYFERMLDDSINLTQMTLFATSKIYENKFELDIVGGAYPPIKIGDVFKVFYPDTGKYSDGTDVSDTDNGLFRVTAVDGKTVTFNKKIPEVKPLVSYDAEEMVLTPADATHFYNMNASNTGYIVRNNVFQAQRRHAIYAKGEGGTISGNTIRDVRGNGIVLENEYSTHKEGPFPRNVDIRNNDIRNTRLSPIKIHSSSGPANTRLVKDIRLYDNTIVTRDNLDVATDIVVKTAIEIENAENIFIGRGNKIYKGSANYNANVLWADPIDQKNVAYIGYPYVLDGSFEAEFNDPNNDGYQYRPGGTPWYFGPPGTTSGYSKNRTAFTNKNDDAPDGDQVLFLQGTGFAAQAVYFEPGMYNVSLLAALRQNYDTTQQLSVLIDGVLVGQLEFSDPNSSIYDPDGFTSGNFSVTDGFHGIKLAGTESDTNKDTTAFVDNVQVNQLYSFASITAALSVLH